MTNSGPVHHYRRTPEQI